LGENLPLGVRLLLSDSSPHAFLPGTSEVRGARGDLRHDLVAMGQNMSSCGLRPGLESWRQSGELIFI
jgi:hypothetical protein